MIRPYAYLLIAIVSEVIATSALKSSKGFTRPGPSALVVVGYGAAFYLMSKCLDAGMAVGIVYAIWSGLGIVLLAAVGLAVYGEKLDLPAVIGVALILAGVVVLNVFSGSVRQS